MRCKFRVQASRANQSQARCLSYLTQSQQWFVKKTRMATLVVLLGLGGAFWLTTEAITPQLAQADTARLDRSLVRQPEETYEDLLRRAEEAAFTEAQASFDQGDGVTNVAITILAQNQGEIAPVLSLEVSRDQWLNQPDAQRWATYFTNSKVLLGFEDVAATTSNQPYTDSADVTPPEQPQTDTADTGKTDDFDGAADQSGSTFSTPNANTTPPDGSAAPTDANADNDSAAPTDTNADNDSAAPTDTTSENGGSVLTPQPAVAAPVEAPGTPEVSTPENDSTTETSGNGLENTQEQPSTGDNTIDGDIVPSSNPFATPPDD